MTAGSNLTERLLREPPQAAKFLTAQLGTAQLITLVTNPGVAAAIDATSRAITREIQEANLRARKFEASVRYTVFRTERGEWVHPGYVPAAEFRRRAHIGPDVAP